MAGQKKIKVIFDTNIWISFLIGKRLYSIKTLIANQTIQIILSDQLISEIILVTQRPRLKKYFTQDNVDDLITLLETIGETYQIKSKNTLCRDPKDNFLLDLIEEANADYLVTGDNDLLELKKFKSAKILKPHVFEKEII